VKEKSDPLKGFVPGDCGRDQGEQPGTFLILVGYYKGEYPISGLDFPVTDGV
jgi:hypothetical protein